MIGRKKVWAEAAAKPGSGGEGLHVGAVAKSKLTFTTVDSTLTMYADAAKIKQALTFSKGDLILWGGGAMQMKDQASGSCSYPLYQQGGDFWTGMFTIMRIDSPITDWKLADNLKKEAF